MKFYIKHETRGRLRIHLAQKRMSYGQADTLLYYLENLAGVVSAKVYERTCDAVVNYRGSRAAVIRGISEFHYQDVEVPSQVLQSSGRALNAEYQEKLISKVICHYGRRLFLPYPLNAIYTTATSLKYIWKGIDTLLHRKIEVPVLDATAIGVSVLRQDFGTAGSIMFLLGIGEILEEWTHKKSVGDLARTMSLNVGRVWLKREDQEILVESGEVQPGDDVVVRMGTVIPFDGSVTDGEAMVNQASLTGESVPVCKKEGSVAYAGTVVEEGEITIRVKTVGGSSRYDKIVTMIEESEKLKSSLEGKAEHLADKLVPYTLGGTALTYLLTRNATKALAILMVDFSCALKLAMPISVLSAIREAGGARWNYMAAWAYANEKYNGNETEMKAFIKKLYKNVLVLDSGARGATTSFVENGQGDVLIAWENEAFLSVRDNPDDYEIVTPGISILAQPSVAVVDENVKKHDNAEAAKAYLKYLYSDEAQELIAENYYRPVDQTILKKHADTFDLKVKLTTIKDFGGWDAVQKKHFADGGVFDEIYEE